MVATGVVEVSSKISLEELRAKFPGDIDLFVCSASFEERCLSVARSVAAKTKDVVIVRNDSYVSTEERNYKALQSLFGGEGHDAAVSSLSPTATADALKSEVVSRIPPNGTVLVDITTFTHEHLLILMALIRMAPVGLGKVIFAYTGAEEYSTNTDEKDVWLSHGVTSVRSILGYPGNMVPSRKLHLIVLVGFESERARSVIEILEPARLSLGVGDEAQSVSVSHYRRNRRFYSRIKDFIATQESVQAEVDTFSFSCVDPIKARATLLEHSSKYEGYNVVITPMNTKISTVGLGLAAFQKPDLQLICSCPQFYNQMGYSSPSEEVRFFPVDLRPL